MLLIPASGWAAVKQRIGNIKEAVNIHLTLASVLLGGFLSTIGLVLFGAIPKKTCDNNNLSTDYIVAWAVSAVLLVLGVGFFFLAGRHQKVQGFQAKQVLDLMEMVEQNCQHAKGTVNVGK